MAIKNKTYDRDDNGHIKRKYTGPSHKWQCAFPKGSPKSWRKTVVIRPKRRECERLCHKALQYERIDDLIFPLGNRKPFIYYW